MKKNCMRYYDNKLEDMKTKQAAQVNSSGPWKNLSALWQYLQL